MTDLNKLIEEVEGGNWEYYIGAAIDAGFIYKQAWLIDRAYHGSLDDAEKLHESLLPGWSAVVQTNGTVQVIGPDYSRKTGVSVDKPARAWLIAALKAYRSMQ